MSRRVERPRRGLWRSEIVRAVLSGHSILGIAFAGLIYLVCLSGTLSVFMRDFQRWEQPAAPKLSGMSDAALARATAEMGRRVGPEKSFYVTLPDKDFPRLMLSSGNDADDETWYADADGRLVTRQEAPWTSFVTELHTRLHLAQTWGRFIVGLTGVALLSSLISGVLAHPRLFRDAFHLRLGGSRRLEQADLHNRLGVWPLPFHIIVSLTGALLGLSTIIVGVLALLLFRGDSQKVYALLAPPPAKVDARPAEMPDMVKLMAVARLHAPAAQPRQINVDHWGRRDMRLELSASRPYLIAQQDSFTFDAGGRIVVEKHPSQLNVGERILGSLGQLHFGWFGGGGIRLAYGLLGLALCIVTSSGIMIWLARRRDKGRAAPALERIWAAIVWGQPLAIAAMAPFALLFPDQSGSILTALWAGLSLILIVGASLLSTTPASRLADGAKVALAGLLVLTAALHIARASGSGGDPLPFAVDALLIVVGLSLTSWGKRIRALRLARYSASG